MNPFDYVNSISHNKKNMMRDTENDEYAEKEYEPFLANRALSYYTDTLLYANEMNKHSSLDNKMQYEYLLHSVRQGKRYSKWAKKTESDELKAISLFYQVNMRVAQQYLKLLSDKDKQELVLEYKKL